MMTDAWERLLRKQDRSFDEALGRQVLDQSRYEKQIMTKLCEVRDLRNRIVENRRIIDAMLLEARENEQRLEEERDQERIKEEKKDVEMEACRLHELHRRMREEKVRRMKERHRNICTKIIYDLVDITLKIVDYRRTNGHIPNFLWNEWRMLFVKNQPILEHTDYFDDVEEAEDVEKTKNENEIKVNEDGEIMENGASRERVSEEEIKIIKESKAEEKQKLIQRQQFLADADFESYLDLTLPWDQFVPKREEEVEEVYRLGCVVLGYIVHRLLEILYPYPGKVMDCPVPRVKVAAIILDVINATLHEQLRELLKNTGIRLLTVEDAINHCLESYKREMVDVEYIDLNIISTMAKDIKKLEVKSKNDSGERHRKKIERAAKLGTEFQQSATEEKQTQTPRQIPYDDMDPVLSNTAYIGR